ncbi:hypothetical protein INR49_005239 [Caranx melampygus]|nr:hypothetical protein INR49_005239 [Caranx melampygus]
MDGSQTSYYTVVDKKSQCRFVCYTHRKNGIFSIRSACGSGDVSVVIHDSRAELQVGSSPSDLRVTLSRLECPQAAEELREILFRMVDRLTQLDIGPVPANLKENHQWRLTEFAPRQQQSVPSVTMKRRLPGVSLINPGAKKKLQATGVAFDDADED